MPETGRPEQQLNSQAEAGGPRDSLAQGPLARLSSQSLSYPRLREIFRIGQHGFCVDSLEARLF